MLKTTGTEDPRNKEFGFTEKDFSRIRKFIYQRAGIALSDSKREMVYSRLSRRLRATGISQFAEYLDRLEQTNDGGEWQAFTNALTTNLTAFFREAHHFPILADHVRDNGGPAKIWCSASSTGEEPYSIAMTLCDTFGTLTPPAQILATDIDTNVLETARKGIYTANRIETLAVDQQRRFFLRGKGGNSGLVRVRPEIARLVNFQQLNLLQDGWRIAGPFDAIFCRNVMIYFDKPTQRRILAKFVPHMKPGGLLFTGHSENFLYATTDFKLRGKTVYDLAAASASAGSDAR